MPIYFAAPGHCVSFRRSRVGSAASIVLAVGPAIMASDFKDFDSKITRLNSLTRIKSIKISSRQRAARRAGAWLSWQTTPWQWGSAEWQT